MNYRQEFTNDIQHCQAKSLLFAYYAMTFLQDCRLSNRSKKERYCFRARRRSSVDASPPPFQFFSSEPRRSAKLFVIPSITSVTRSSASVTEALGSSTNLLWIASQRV